MARATGMWTKTRPELDGCFDLDLESSACTNAFPVHRLQLAIGETASAPAAYVRADDLRVERLEQSYRRVDDREYDYESPVADFRCRLVFDDVGIRAGLSRHRDATSCDRRQKSTKASNGRVSCAVGVRRTAHRCSASGADTDSIRQPTLVTKKEPAARATPGNW